MKYNRLIAVSVFASFIAASSIHAEEVDVAALADRVSLLEAKIEALLAENEALRSSSALASAPAATVAPKPAAKPSPSPVTIGGKESKLSLGGYLHVQGEAGDAADSRFAGANDRIRLRRARLTLKGNMGEDLSFQAQTELAGSPKLTDLFIAWSKYPAANVKIGQFKTPFGAEQLNSDTKVPFIERSLGSDKLTAGRDIGVGLSGQSEDKRFGYSTGMFNGNGTNQSNNDNDSFLFVGRVTGTLFNSEINGTKANWQLGGNWYSNDITSSAFSGTREGFGVDTEFKFGAANFLAEWLSNESDPLLGANSKSDAWQVAAIYRFDNNWQAVARFETYDANANSSGGDSDTVTLGANYFLYDDALKLSFNYLFGEDDDRLIVRAQLIY